MAMELYVAHAKSAMLQTQLHSTFALLAASLMQSSVSAIRGIMETARYAFPAKYAPQIQQQ